MPYAALERLWSRRNVALRDKTLWRLLYETAARASEALSLNVEDLDLPARRAVIRGKNGELDYLHWQTGTGHLLSRLTAGRPSGPVFLTDRRASPGQAPAAAALCPHTGLARLSYRRAAELFSEATGGWTLHQLRHSAVTHLAEQNVALPLLMAKSRHTSPRSLQKYARPGVDADLRAQLEQRAHQHTARAGARKAGQHAVSVASLRADLANARSQNHRLREQLHALEQRLAELDGARAQIFELTEALADAHEELDAVREITENC